MRIEAQIESAADKSSRVSYTLVGDTTEIKDFYYALLSAAKYYTQKNPTTPDIAIKKLPEKRKKEEEDDSIIFSIVPSADFWHILSVVIYQSMTCSITLEDFIQAYQHAKKKEEERIAYLNKAPQITLNNARINLILCVGKNGSMMFNSRRVSRDNVVTGKITEIANDRLYIYPYSSDLFPNANIFSDETTLTDGDYVFIENKHPAEFIEHAKYIYLFNWNRTYPADISIDINAFSSFRSIGKEDFSGMSHDKITLEVFECQ